MSAFRAKQDNVLIRLLPRETQSKGGIHLPATRKHNRVGVREGEVLAVGPGHYRDSGFGALVPTTVKVGEIVLIDELAGQDYALDNYRPRQNPKGADWDSDGSEYRVVREDEIHAVVERA